MDRKDKYLVIKKALQGLNFVRLSKYWSVDLTSKKSNQIWELLGRIYTLKPIIGQNLPSGPNHKRKTDLELKIKR